MLARTRKWVESWNRVQELPDEKINDYLLGKCRNGYQMARKPSRDQREAWVTLLAEAGKTRDELSPRAMEAVNYVRQRLEQEGYDFELHLDETGGVGYAEVHFRSLTKNADRQKKRPAKIP